MTNQAGSAKRDKTLSVALVLIALATIGTLFYVIAVPKLSEPFTEFYILGNESKADDYPRELMVGEEAEIIIGIVNREHETVSYHLELRLNQVKNQELGPLVLEHGEKWEETINFQPAIPGDNQKLELLLYKDGQIEPYRSLYLWFDVNR